jgi:hypothetical protein
MNNKPCNPIPNFLLFFLLDLNISYLGEKFITPNGACKIQSNYSLPDQFTENPEKKARNFIKLQKQNQ